VSLLRRNVIAGGEVLYQSRKKKKTGGKRKRDIVNSRGGKGRCRGGRYIDFRLIMRKQRRHWEHEQEEFCGRENGRRKGTPVGELGQPRGGICARSSSFSKQWRGGSGGQWMNDGAGSFVRFRGERRQNSKASGKTFTTGFHIL